VTIDPGGTGIAGTITCPRCEAPVEREQDWCLTCGAAARTRLIPPPDWRIPAASVAVLAVLAGLVLAIAFVDLTRQQTETPGTTSTTQAPTVTQPPPAATTPPPGG
jgi:hypothetical protein